MSGNVCSQALGDRLAGLGPVELLALARAAVDRYAGAGGGVEGLLGLAGEALGRAAARPLEGPEGPEDGGLVESVAACHRLEARVHAEKLRRAAAVQRRGAYRGRAHNSVNLWVSRLGLSRGQARTLVDSALALARMPEAAARHAQGRLAAGHVADAARTVAQLDKLDADPEAGPAGAQAARADAAVAELDRLVAAAADGDGDGGGPDGEGDAGGGPAARPPSRQVLRQRLEAFQHARAPGLLAERERRLRARRSLRLGRDPADPDRQPRLDARLAPFTFAKARTVLHALARQHDAGDARSFEQRCHDAFERVLDLAIASGQLPDLAGDQPRVLLQVHADTLHDHHGAPQATLDGYGPVSAATARQACCDAEITAVALGQDREVLNVGRDRRQPNRRQRRGVFTRDGGCVGCGTPLAYCQIHHIIAWDHDGPTDIDNLVAVCWECHTNLHHHGWHVVRDPHGRHRLRPPHQPAAQTQRLAG